jgi:hypothetical protein
MIFRNPRVLLTGKVLLGLVYCLAAGEVFVRLFAPQPMLPRYVCPTSYGIRGNTPNMTYRHKAPEYSIELHVNSKGIRADREIPYEKPAGVRRVLLLGDSFGMGYGVSLEDMFLTRMVESLEAAGVPCEAVNLSVSGFGNSEELVALREEGFRYSPDLVVVAWHCTDFEDNVRSDLYALEEGRLVRRSATYLPAVKSRQLFFQLPLARWLAVHSHLYCCLREKAGATAKFKVLPALLRLTQREPDAPASGTGDAPPRDDYPERLSVALLAEIQRQCQEHGANLLVLDIPNRRSRAEFSSSFPAKQAAGVVSLHIYSPIADFQKYAGQKLYWEKEHGHFTPLACRIVGEGLAKAALELGLLTTDNRRE